MKPVGRSMTEPTAYDMGRFYRVVGTVGRVSGSWDVMKLPESARDDFHVRPIDVHLWDENRRSSRVLYSDSLTAFVRDGVVDIPEHMIRDVHGVKADVLDALDEVKATILAATRSANFDTEPGGSR